MNILVILLILIALAILIQPLMDWYCYEELKEKFGGVGVYDSLYSNDGIQDIYLTVNNDRRGYYDPYAYWSGYPWWLPTRNLNSMVFYPYLYDYYADRYGRRWPYW